MRKNIILALALVVVLTGAVLMPSPAKAAKPGDEGHKITICHRTNSATNPYVSIKVDENAADGVSGNSGNQADHYGEHQGPLASSVEVAKELKKQKIEWGDIIPPIDGVHDGLNWTAEGQAIYNNGCKIPDENPGEPFEEVKTQLECTDTRLVLTLINNGNSDRQVVVEGMTFSAAAGESTIVLLPLDTKDFSITIKGVDVEGYTEDQVVNLTGTCKTPETPENPCTVNCEPGKGGGETPKTPEAKAQPTVKSLPYTGASTAGIATLITLVSGLATAGISRLVRARLG